MSCYVWEAGTITLPAAAVPGLRKALNTAAVTYRALVLAEIEAVWNDVKALPLAKRVAAIPDWVSLPVSYDDVHAHRRADARMRAQCILKSSGGRKPTRAVLAQAFPTPNARTREWGESEFGLTLDGRTLHWEVPQNNHARDHAAVTGLYQAALTYLNAVTWTRGTGGVIVGNDEYNRDTTYEGGGGNYVTHRFGPAGQ